MKFAEQHQTVEYVPLQELPRRISTDEEREILSLLCKVHELEIEKVEMQSEAVLKEHEVKRRDLLILKYDKQRALTDEIIQRQRKLIEGERNGRLKNVCSDHCHSNDF